MLGSRKLAIALLLFPLGALAQVGTPVRQAQTVGSAGSLSATAANAGACGGTSCVTVNTTGYGVATVTVHGTYTGSTLNFEFTDDGTNWYSEACSETVATVQEASKSPSANASLAWDCGIYAATKFEVRQSAVSTGTAVVTVTLSAAGIEPASTIAVSGTPTVRVTGNAGANVDGPTGSAVPANAVLIGGTDGTNTVAPYIDPCQRGPKTQTAISVSTATATKLVALASAKVTYICSINLVVSGATNVVLTSGTKVTNECDTSATAINGGTTAASGWNLAANGGLTQGNGQAWIMSGASAKDVCLTQSGTAQISGTITTVQF